MSRKKQAGQGKLAKGDIVRFGGGWWFVCSSVWNDGETYLATPLTDPYYPERRSMGPPQIIKMKEPDEVIKQSAAGGEDVDPLKGSGR